MARKTALPPEIFAVFREESREQLESVAAGLEQLERADDPAIRSDIKRHLHNVKGAAGSLGLTAIARVAHAAEDLFLEAADDVVPTDTLERLFAAVTWLLRALDQRRPRPKTILERLGSRQETGPGDEQTEPAQEPEEDEKSEPSWSSRDETFVRVQSSALERLLSPVADLATRRSEIRFRADRLSELAETGGVLAYRASTGALAAEDIAGLRDAARELDGHARDLRETARRTSIALADLEEQVRRMRLVPLSSMEQSLRLAVRDAAERTGKRVSLDIVGGDAGLDRRRLEILKAPLLHLVRNAVDHGIESPEKRRAANKPEEGQVKVSLVAQGDRVVLSVEDDGAGIDVERVREQSVAGGYLGAQEAAALTREQLLALVATQGFSTASGVTELSGRGVGVDVARQAVEASGGSLIIESRWGQGTSFRLAFPAALITSRVLMVRATEQTYALPLTDVEGTARPLPDAFYPLAELDFVEVLGASARVHRLNELHSAPPSEGPVPVVVVETPVGRVAIVVDAILGEEEVVVRPLGPPLGRVVGISGAVLGDMGVVPVLNAAEILEVGVSEETGIGLGPQGPVERVCVLVVDDSLTTRTLERHVLESSGYLVRVASDGKEALDILRKQRCELVVSDVEMPVLDGIGLVRQMREDPTLTDIPIILVTSLESDDDRRRGLAAGAQEYIVKSRFDQEELLDTVRRLLGR